MVSPERHLPCLTFAFLVPAFIGKYHCTVILVMRLLLNRGYSSESRWFLKLWFTHSVTKAVAFYQELCLL